MHIVIIGNGISGITAARYLRKLSDHQITVISKETRYFFSRTALMYLYMGHMRERDLQPYDSTFWTKNRIDLLQCTVENIDFTGQKLSLDNGSELQYDRLVLALGSIPNKFGWPGQDLKRVQGLYSMQDLHSMENYSKHLQQAVIVGGGLIGIEMAEMFHSRHIPVTMLVREASYWDIVLPANESDMINKHIIKQGIDLRLSTELQKIKGDDQGHACGVVTNKGEEIPCQFVGLTAGVRPNIHWLEDTTLETDRGILVDNHLQTNIPNVYAIGDCAQLQSPRPGRRPVEAVWYTGRMMGEVAAYNICDHRVPYDPGIWFNSAKFFDIEYQVYGSVPTMPDPALDHLFWQHSKEEVSVRIVFNKATQVVVGFNLMGTRFRHEVCEQWIRTKSKVAEVISNLALASFDPEFFKPYHPAIIRKYNGEHGTNLKASSKRRFDDVFKFLNR